MTSRCSTAPTNCSRRSARGHRSRWLHFERLFGSLEAYQQANAHLLASAEGTGIAFNLDPMPKVANTFFAHRVVAIHQGTRSVAQRAVLMAFVQCILRAGPRLSDQDVVLRAASSASGRSVDEIRAALEGDEDGASVLADRDGRGRSRVQAVPTFVAQGRLAVPRGAASGGPHRPDGPGPRGGMTASDGRRIGCARSCLVDAEECAVPKLVYDFAEGHKDLKDLLGGKAPTSPK